MQFWKFKLLRKKCNFTLYFCSANCFTALDPDLILQLVYRLEIIRKRCDTYLLAGPILVPVPEFDSHVIWGSLKWKKWILKLYPTWEKWDVKLCRFYDNYRFILYDDILLTFDKWHSIILKDFLGCTKTANYHWL
jgi:hypothetical protein